MSVSVEDGLMSHSAVESSESMSLDLDNKKLIRVLLVDDEPVLLKLTKQFLEMECQFQADTALSAEEAVKKMNKETYDVVVSDYKMPIKDGLELLKELRRRGDTVPFIMFTGRGREEVAIDALNLGADQYLNKTGSPETVYGELAHAIRRAADRKSVQQKIRESEERYRSIFETAPNSIVTLNMKGVITSCNATLTKHTGFSKDEIVGRHFSELGFLYPEDTPKFLESFATIMKGKMPEPMQASWHRKDGTNCFSELHFSPIRENDKTVGIQAIAIDITERKTAEFQLQESERTLRELADQLPVIVYEIDTKGRFTFVNERGFEITGYSCEDVEKGLNIFQLVAGEYQDIAKTRVQKSLNGEKIGYNEYTVTKKDGSTFPALVCSSAIVRAGKIVGLRGIVVDITERKKMEDAVSESERKYGDFLANSRDAVYTHDLKGKIVSVNRVVEEYGFKREEIVGKNILKFVSKKYWPKIIAQLSQIARGNMVEGEIEVVTPVGKRIAEYRSSPIRRGEKVVGVQSILRDTTERKKAEETLRESEEKFRNLAEQSPNMIFINEKGRIVYANKKAEETMGYTREEFYSPDFEFLTLIALESRKPMESNFARHMKGQEVEPIEYRLLTKQGRTIDAILTTKLITYGGKPAILGTVTDIADRKKAEKAVLESQRKFEGLFMGNPEAAAYLGPDCHILNVNPRFEELFGYSLAEIEGKHIDDVVVQRDKLEEAQMLNERAVEGYVYHNTVRRRKNGSSVPVAVSAAPVTVGGSLAGIVAMYKDISDLKKAERKLEMMNEKLQVVGGLTRHDVRNKLSTITGNIYLSKKRLADRPEAFESFQDIESACQQIVRIFDFAKDYEMLGVEELKYVDVEKIVDEAASLFPNLQETKITNACDGLTVLADSLLRELFLNLIDNSLKYGGKLSQIRIYHEKAEADRLSLIYEDDGVGIAGNSKSKIFREGYTTGKGSGYGLYLVKRMMEVYGWNIRETGVPGKGVQFTIEIPHRNQDGKENYRLRSSTS